MEWYPKISIQYILHGDRAKCESLVGLGRRLLFATEQDMRFQKLPTGMKRLVLDDGSIILTSINYGIPRVEIITAGGEEEYEEARECFCKCHLAQGFVRLPDDYKCYYHYHSNILYNVDVCAMKKTYVFIENCMPIAFTEYEDKQPVIVLWANDQEGAQTDYTKIGDEACFIKRCRITDFLPLKRHELHYQQK